MKVEDSEAAVQSRADSAPMLVAVGIDKAFDRTRALAGAELDVYPGEVMGLLGANGAGKSTLSKVISGHVIRDAGSITLQGRPLSLRTAREAIQHGITMVMQETSLAPDLSVLENVFLAELGRPGWLSYRRLKRQAEEILDRLGQTETLPLDREVRSFSPRRNVNWSRLRRRSALNSTLIIFDEPTASLSPPEVERLFQVMTTLEAGRSYAGVCLAPARGSICDYGPGHRDARRPHGSEVASNRVLKSGGVDPPDGRPRDENDIA